MRLPEVVILGAGFDTRASRLPALGRTRVFEVDHPATQAAKRERLGPLPAHLVLVALDFDRERLRDGLLGAGFDPRARAFLVSEGVTNYLTEAAVDATLLDVAATAAPGSLLLFTYVHRDILTRPEAFAGTKQLFAALERAGERFTFGIEPSHLSAFLAERGLRLEWDVGCAEFRERAYGERARSMRGHEFYRVALARVARPA